jgi:hypothetical protein
MRSIRLETVIVAPIGDCFDLSLSVDAHTASMRASGEQAIGGVRSGTMKLGDLLPGVPAISASCSGQTRMVDVVVFQSPFGVLGRIADGLVLSHYLRHLLRQRNTWLKTTLEGSAN